MEKLNISLGIRSFQLQEGCPPLRFRPDDPNVYARVLEAVDTLEAIGTEYTEEARKVDTESENGAKDALLLMKRYDAKAKSVLNEAFGAQNNFDHILGGVSLLNTTDGKPNFEIVLDALTPLFEDGIHKYADELAKSEGANAAMNREQRRALEHGGR